MEDLSAQAIRELEKRVLNDTVAANRNAAAAVATLFAAIGFLMLASMHYVRASSDYMLVISWAGLALLSICPVLMMLRPKEDAYPVVQFWVGLVGVLIVFQIINYIFGLERTYFIDKGWPPFLLISIPIYVILTRTFLIGAHARRAQALFLAVLGFASVVHWQLFGAVAAERYGMVMLTATIWFYGPMIILFVEFTLRLQGAAHRQLRAEIVAAQRRQSSVARMNAIDPVTGLLRREGVEEALELAFSSHNLTGLALIEIANIESIARYCEVDDFNKMMHEVADVLRDKCGYQLNAGRWDGQRFVLWGNVSESEESWSARVDDLSATVDQHFADGMYAPDIQAVSVLVPQGADVSGAMTQLIQNTPRANGLA